MVGTEFVAKGVQRLQDIEKLLDGDFFSELSDRQEEYNGLHAAEIQKDLQQYTDAEVNLVWVADSMDYYKERIRDLQKVLQGEMTTEEAEERILGDLKSKADLINEILHQEPKMTDGYPHYTVHIGASDDDSQQLVGMAQEAAEVIVHHLDYSKGKASVAYWTKGLPELIYISTYSLDEEGMITEARDMSSSTV